MDNPSGEDQGSLLLRTKSSTSSRSTTSSNYDRYLQLATEKNPVMLLELDQDGTIRYLSELWDKIVGPRSTSQISELIVGSEQDKHVFHRAMEMMLSNENVSYTVTFNVLTSDKNEDKDADYELDTTNENDDNNDNGRTDVAIEEDNIMTLEACGILLRDNSTQLFTHSMWTVKPFQPFLVENELEVTLPPDLIKRLGFGATIFAEYLKAIEFDQILYETNLPSPKMELCRVCETFVPAWWLEAHSRNCICEHRIDSFLHLLHDNLVEQLALLQSESLTEYKSLPINMRSRTTERIVAQLQELCEIAIDINQSEMRVHQNEDISTEALLANPMNLTQSTSMGAYDFSPNSKWNIENVQNWQLSMKEELSQDEGLNLLVSDTVDLAKKKVDAILRLDNAMTYSLRIKNEVNNWVLQLILLQIENNRMNAGLYTDYDGKELGIISEENSGGHKNSVLDDEKLPSASSCAISDTVIEQSSSARTAEPALSAISNVKIASPQPHRVQQSEIFAPSYLVNDQIAETSSKDTTIRHTQRQGRRNGEHDLGTGHSGSLSRSLTPKQRIESHPSQSPSGYYSLESKKDEQVDGEIVENSESSQSSLPALISNRQHTTGSSIVPKLKSTISLTPGRNSPLPHSLTAAQMSRKSSSTKLNQERSPIVSPFASAKDYLTPEQHPNLLSIPKQPLSPLLLATNQLKNSTPSIRDYDILKPISKGAYGSVYLSRKKLTGEYFAIKVLKKSDMIAKNQITNVKSERAIMMVQSDKPYVARLFASFQNKDNLFLVMEYLPGGDLAALIKMMGSLPSEWTKQYISEVIVGVEDMHQLGIIHHDLKPDNLLIDSNGHVKLTDFGLSRAGLVRRHQHNPPSTRLSLSSSYGISGSPIESKNVTGHNRKRSSTSTNCSNHSGSKVPPRSRQNSIKQENIEAHCSPHILKEGSYEKPPIDSPANFHLSNEISALHRSDSQMSFSFMNPSRSTTPTPPLVGSFQGRSGSTDMPVDLSTPSDLALFNPDDSRQEMNFFGTPDYLAPETIEGTGEDDTCDWWSVGCILFELIFGYPPFHASSPEKVFTNILSGVIEWPDFSSPEDKLAFESSHAKDLIERLLVVDPSKRLGFNGAQEIKDHPYFKDVDWENVYEEEASFVPAVEHPEDTDYFDLRGAILEDFGDEDDVPSAPLPSADAPTGFGQLLYADENIKKTPSTASSNNPVSIVNTPVNKLSISSVLESVSPENSSRSSLPVKHMPLAIPPHMRDRRISKLNDSQTEFGSFYFRNLSALDKANKDAINRLKSKHMTDSVGVHRRASSVSYISSSSDSSNCKTRTGKVSATGSPVCGKPTSTSDSPYFGSSSPDLSISIETAGLSRKGSGDNNVQTPASSYFMPWNDESPSSTKIRSPLSPSNVTSPTSPTFAPAASSNSVRTRLTTKCSSQRTSSGDISAEENDRLAAILKVNSLRYRRRSGRKSSASSDLNYRMDVLVCEPIPIHRYRVTKDLESLGCTVVSVGAGDELVSRATSGIKFDLIITALKLPKLGAVDIVKLLKQTNGINATTPVVAVTNYYQEAVNGNVFDDVLEKPVNYDQLRKVAAKYALEKVEKQEDTIVSDSEFSQ
ncbi:hypothetical protein HG536_0B06680 [Torulaspora globosa]|uniref:non-specific serine/threonine protein kinase n=1 Tax=Torulaspora globosa TaxID=48254 RepID=A0A7G3ZE64_9SACH|nr:uncharacterized protein HG536_0B06680 [Torulaspora globosa]QLL31800.1 hypothetical protein HG536_0B06680 [Torulaspora globosa]